MTPPVLSKGDRWYARLCPGTESGCGFRPRRRPPTPRSHAVTSLAVGALEWLERRTGQALLGAAFMKLGFDAARDRKSTRLNSSHRCISYAVFCLKKKKKKY